MKRFIGSVSIVLLLILLSGPATAGEGPSIKPIKKIWDFGSVNKNRIKEKTFKIKNMGDEDLTIEKIRACCGYKVVDISSWDLLPGEISKVRIQIDASRKNHGKDKKFITIISNDKDRPRLKIPVHSYVVGKIPVKFRLFDRSPRVPLISAGKVKRYIDNKEDITLLDVREKSEFSEKHIPGSINLPRSSIVSYEDIPSNILEGVNKKEIIVVICASGTRSSFIADELKGRGHNSYNMKGGLKSWEKQGYDLSRGPKTPQEEKPIVIGLEEAYRHYYKLFKRKVIWVDVRNKEDYRKGHIKGAINKPLNVIEKTPDVLPKDKSLVLYCDGIGCGQSFIAGKILIRNGYKQGRIRILNEGFQGWRKEGYPIQR